MLKELLRFLGGVDGDVRRKTLRAGVWVGISAMLGAPLALVKSIALARLLTPEIFGLWAIGLMVIRGVDLLTQTGFGAALIHRQTSFAEARDTAFTLSVIRGIILAIVAVSLAPAVASFYEHGILLPLVSFLSFAFVFSGFHNINTVLYQKELNFQRLVYLEQAQSLFSFVFVLGLAYLYQSIWALAVGHVVSALIAVLLSFAIVPGRPGFALNRKIAWELFHYGKYITGLTMVLFIASEIDKAVIGKILGMEALGFYVLAYSLANLPATHLSKVLSKILFPAYSMLQNDLVALRAAFMRAVEFVSLATVPITLLFIALANELIGVVYGQQWLPAADALIVLAVFGSLRAISSLNGYLFNAVGRPNIPFYLNLGKLVVVAVAIVPATVHFGITGAAMAITLPMLVQYLVSMMIVSGMLHVRYSDLFRPTVRYVIIGSAVAVGVHYLKLRLGEIVLLEFLALFFGGLFLFALICWKDVRALAVALRDRRDER